MLCLCVALLVLWDVCVLFMCVIFLFSKNIDKNFLVCVWYFYFLKTLTKFSWSLHLTAMLIGSKLIVFALLYVLVDYYTIHLYTFIWTALLREIMAHWINLDVVFCCFYRQNLNKGVFENDLLSWKLFQMLPSFFKGPKQAVRALSLFDGISTGKELYLCLYSNSIQ